MSRRLIMSDNFLAARDATQRAMVQAWEAKQQVAPREMKFPPWSDKFSYRSLSDLSRDAKFVSLEIKSSHMLQLRLCIGFIHGLQR